MKVGPRTQPGGVEIDAYPPTIINALQNPLACGKIYLPISQVVATVEEARRFGVLWKSGRSEIYLSQFPSGSGKWQVSRGGGGQPEWNRDSTALYYVAPGGKMMEASVKESGATVVVGDPRELFQAARAATSLGARSYGLSQDGKRFLVAKAPQIVASPLTLVTNWTADLKK